MNNKIEDFGDRLEGARKFYAQEHIRRLENAQGTSLNELWPAPNWQKLVDEGSDPWVVGLIRTIRESISPRPTGRHAHFHQPRWETDVLAGRMLAIAWLDRNEDEVNAEIKGDLKNKIWKHTAKARAYANLGHARSLRTYRFIPDSKGELWTVRKKARGWYDPVSQAVPLSEAIEQVRAHLQENEGAKRKRKPMKFGIYHFRNDFGVGRTYYLLTKIGPKGTGFRNTGYLNLREFNGKNASNEGEQYLKEHRDELEEEVRQWRTIPHHRRETNRLRQGPQRREDLATPDMFMQTFAPKGVQFGNYVNNKERQDSLNQAYDALLDLAEILNVPPKALFLDSTLGLAFGARGRGGINSPSAHYEPDFRTINLTKPRGAGSLAHEWFHAFDFWAASQLPAVPGAHPPRTLSDHAALEARTTPTPSTPLGRLLSAGHLQQRSKNLDNRRSKPYWAKSLEITARSFEAFVKAECRLNGIQNDYLVNVVPFEAWTAAWPTNNATKDSDYPYPVNEEMKIAAEVLPPVIQAHMQELCQALDPEDKNAWNGTAVHSIPSDAMAAA